MTGRARWQVTTGVALALMAGALLGWIFSRRGGDEAVSLREVAVRGLAEHLAKTFPGQRVLVLANPFSTDTRQPKSVRAIEAASIRALQRVLGESQVTVAWPELRLGARENPQAFVADPETTTPLSFLVAEGAIDALVRQHPDCGLAVSLIGLPVNLGSVTAWAAPTGPKFALLLPDLRMLGDAAAVRAAMQSGKLAAFVLNRPGTVPTVSQTGKAVNDAGKATFDHHFLLVTAENFEVVARAHPKLFEAAGALAR